MLFAIVAIIGWSTSGAEIKGLERIAFAAPTVFAIAFAVRAIGTLPFSEPAGVRRSVVMDVGVVVAALIFIVVVGSFGDASGLANYGGMIIAMFLVPATPVASLMVEMVRRIPWLTRVAATGAIVTGLAALAVYAQALTA